MKHHFLKTASAVAAVAALCAMSGGCSNRSEQNSADTARQIDSLMTLASDSYQRQGSMIYSPDSLDFALSAVEQAIALDTTALNAYLLKAQIYEQAGMAHQQAQALEAALRAGSNPYIVVGYARALAADGRSDEAVEQYNVAINDIESKLADSISQSERIDYTLLKATTLDLMNRSDEAMGIVDGIDATALAPSEIAKIQTVRSVIERGGKVELSAK